jgi:hypothetical protein
LNTSEAWEESVSATGKYWFLFLLCTVYSLTCEKLAFVSA